MYRHVIIPARISRGSRTSRAHPVTFTCVMQSPLVWSKNSRWKVLVLDVLEHPIEGSHSLSAYGRISRTVNHTLFS
jgi:hypothetical protein